MRAGTGRLVALAVAFTVAAGGYAAVIAGGNAPYAGTPETGWSATSGNGSPRNVARVASTRPNSAAARRGAAGGALERFRVALARRPDDPTAIMQLADQLSRNDRRAGDRAFALLVRAYPVRASVWTGAAAAHYRAGDRERAEAEITRALRLDPRLAGARLLRGRLLAEGDSPDIAAATWEWRRVIEAAPGTPEAREAALLLRLHEGR